MSDEIEWAREIFDAGTPGPWRVEQALGCVKSITAVSGGEVLGSARGKLGSARGELVVYTADANIIALLGSIRKELLTVVEAACAERKASAALMLMRSTDIMADKDDAELLRLTEGWTAALGDAREARNEALKTLDTSIRTHRERTETDD